MDLRLIVMKQGPKHKQFTYKVLFRGRRCFMQYKVGTQGVHQAEVRAARRDMGGTADTSVCQTEGSVGASVGEHWEEHAERGVAGN